MSNFSNHICWDCNIFWQDIFTSSTLVTTPHTGMYTEYYYTIVLSLLRGRFFLFSIFHHWFNILDEFLILGKPIPTWAGSKSLHRGNAALSPYYILQVTRIKSATAISCCTNNDMTLLYSLLKALQTATNITNL